MSKRGQPEFRLACVVADFLDMALPSDAVWFAIPNGEKRSVTTGARLKRIGVKAGAPDLLIIYRGRAHFIELKAPDGELSNVQKSMAAAIIGAGGEFDLCRSLDTMVELCDAWEVPLRCRPTTMRALANKHARTA